MGVDYMGVDYIKVDSMDVYSMGVDSKGTQILFTLAIIIKSNLTWKTTFHVW